MDETQRLPLVVVYLPKTYQIVNIYEIPDNRLYNYSIRSIFNMDYVIDSNYMDYYKGDIYDHVEEILLDIFQEYQIEGYNILYPNM